MCFSEVETFKLCGHILINSFFINSSKPQIGLLNHTYHQICEAGVGKDDDSNPANVWFLTPTLPSPSRNNYSFRAKSWLQGCPQPCSLKALQKARGGGWGMGVGWGAEGNHLKEITFTFIKKPKQLGHWFASSVMPLVCLTWPRY